MRFITLYSYSFAKSPKNLRLAIVACRISLLLTIVSSTLFLLIIFTLVKNEQQNQQLSAINETFANNQTNIDVNNSSLINNNDHQPSIKLAKFDLSVSLIILAGFLLIIANMASILYALYKYRTYKRLQLVNYEMINRSFDQMQRAQLKKMKILEPIISTSDCSINNQSNCQSVKEPITIINVAAMADPAKSNRSIQSANSQHNNNEQIKNKIKSGKSLFRFRIKPNDQIKQIKLNPCNKMSYAKRDMTI